MTAKLTDRDWELLSTYLDAALSSEEARQVEARLLQDGEFQRAYHSLLETREILRNVPKVRHRKNFFLTPEMLRPTGWQWLIPVMNYSSAAAAVLAVLFLALDILPAGKMTAPVTPAMQAAPLIQATSAPGKMEYSADIPPAPEITAAEDKEKGLPTATIAELEERSGAGGEVAGQMMEADSAALSEEELNSAVPPEPAPPVVAAAPLFQAGGGQPSSPGVGEETDHLTAPATATVLPTMAALGKAAPAVPAAPAAKVAIPTLTGTAEVNQIAQVTVAGQSTVNAVTVTGTDGSKNDAATPVVVQPANPRPSQDQGAHWMATPQKPEDRSQPWSPSRAGGILLLLSISFAVIGYLLKRFHQY